MLEKEFKYYKDNQADLFNKYANMFVVIKNEQVQHSAKSFEDALKYATDKFELGTFLIQECTSDDSGHTQTFHSRAIFASVKKI